MRAVVGAAAAGLVLLAGSVTYGGTAGAASPPKAAAAATVTNWPAYHGSNYRGGNDVAMPAASGTPAVVTKLALDGKVYAAPIVVNGVTIVATENNTVYAFNSAYQKIWSRHLGTPSPASQRPCGNVDPLGITGTPAYSAKTGFVYVAPEFSGSPPTHQVYALRASTGAVAWHHSLDLAGVDRVAMQERGALLADASHVYVPFGGLAGDCGNYKGRVVGYALSGSGSAISYTVPTAREAGIWTPPGPVENTHGQIFVAVGNGASGVGDSYDHSDSILRLSTSLTLQDYFSPTTWASDNDKDLDLGSQGPAMVGSWVFSAGKSGTAYVLRQSSLGHIGGQVSKASLCKSYGGTAFDQTKVTVYVPCTDGVRAVRIDSNGVMHVVWHAASNVTGSPIIGGGRVWSLDTGAGVLYALNVSTGATAGHVSVGAVTRFATPAPNGRDLLIPTLAGITVVRTS